MPGCCARCSRQVFQAEEKLAIGRAWHTFCFSCCMCKRLLDQQCYESDGRELYCRKCYKICSDKPCEQPEECCDDPCFLWPTGCRSKMSCRVTFSPLIGNTNGTKCNACGNQCQRANRPCTSVYPKRRVQRTSSSNGSSTCRQWLHHSDHCSSPTRCCSKPSCDAKQQLKWRKRNCCSKKAETCCPPDNCDLSDCNEPITDKTRVSRIKHCLEPCPVAGKGRPERRHRSRSPCPPPTMCPNLSRCASERSCLSAGSCYAPCQDLTREPSDMRHIRMCNPLTGSPVLMKMKNKNRCTSPCLDNQHECSRGYTSRSSLHPSCVTSSLSSLSCSQHNSVCPQERSPRHVTRCKNHTHSPCPPNCTPCPPKCTPCPQNCTPCPPRYPPESPPQFTKKRSFRPQCHSPCPPRYDSPCHLQCAAPCPASTCPGNSSSGSSCDMSAAQCHSQPILTSTCGDKRTMQATPMYRQMNCPSGLPNDGCHKPLCGRAQACCQRCNRKVYHAEMKIASGSAFHDACFSCFVCRKPLEHITLNEKNGEIYCKQCLIRNFGPAGYGFGIGAGALQTPD